MGLFGTLYLVVVLGNETMWQTISFFLIGGAMFALNLIFRFGAPEDYVFVVIYAVICTLIAIYE